MIRARGTGAHGRPILFIGLEEENIKRMKDGKPVHIHCDDQGVALDIVLLAGKDVETLKESMGELIGPETSVRDLRNEKKN